MIPDLKSFIGLSREALKQKLNDEGYEILRRSHLCSVYHQPGSDVVLRVSMRPMTSALTCDYFMKHEGNSYLPKVYAHATLDEGTHISVMERLVSIEEMAEDGQPYLFGMARYMASFPFGDRTHNQVHPELAKDQAFVAAVHALVNCAIESFDNFADQDECLFLDRDVDGIMYRAEPDGSFQPVLVDTLTYTTPSDEIAQQFNSILARLRALEYDEYYKRTPAPPCRGPSVI